MDNKLHIAWVNEVADLTGGCERYIYNTVSLLKKDGHTNTFLYGVDGWTSPEFLKAFDYAFPLVNVEKQISEIKPDVVYIHRLEDKFLQDFLQLKTPSVRFYHDHKLFCLREHKYKTLTSKTCTQATGFGCYTCLGFINRSENFYKVKIHRLGKIRKQQNLNKKLDGYVVASEYMKKHLEQHGFSVEKTEVMPLYTLPPEEKNEDIKRKDDTLLFVGQLVRGKGVDTLLKAMSLLNKKPKLLIIGDGRQRYMFEEMSRQLLLTEQVTFLGKQSNLSSYYAESTCLVFPSRSPETFGLVGPEAMSYSLPVIASDVGGIREWLVDGETGLIAKPNCPESLAEKIDKMFSDKNMRKKMEQKSFENYEKLFTPEQHMKKLLEYMTKMRGNNR